MRMIPMPSPKGTNYARLFIPVDWTSRGLAMDQKPDPKDLDEYRREKHEEGATALYARICDALKGRIDPRDPVFKMIEELAEHTRRHPDAVTAGDQEGEGDLLEFLAARLSPEHLRQVKELLAREDAAGGDDDGYGPPDHPGGSGWPIRTTGPAEHDGDGGVAFRGARALAGGGLSMDACSKYYGSVSTYEPRQPAAGTPLSRALRASDLIRHDPCAPEPGRVSMYEPKPARLAFAMDAGDDADYRKMFPGVSRIGHLG